MPDNFFTDNLDLQFHLDKLDLAEVVEILEEGYRYHAANTRPRRATMPMPRTTTACC